MKMYEYPIISGTFFLQKSQEKGCSLAYPCMCHDVSWGRKKKSFSMDRVKMYRKFYRIAPDFIRKIHGLRLRFSPTSSSLIVNRKDRVLGPRKREGSSAGQKISPVPAEESFFCPMKVAMNWEIYPIFRLTH